MQTTAKDIQQLIAAIRAKTSSQPAITWEYCQLADVPKPGTVEHENALLYFPSDDSTIFLPSANVLVAINELGAQGWEIVNVTVIRDLRWPLVDTRSSLSYVLENALKLYPKGAAYAYESLAIGLVYLFKRAKRG
jgi:hypothetical protein